MSENTASHTSEIRELTEREMNEIAGGFGFFDRLSLACGGLAVVLAFRYLER